jgi:hypothetical protein
MPRIFDQWLLVIERGQVGHGNPAVMSTTQAPTTPALPMGPATGAWGPPAGVLGVALALAGDRPPAPRPPVNR